MFIGHFAVGFAAKKVAPKQNLAVLMLAPLFLDLVFPVLVLAGVERMHVDPGNTKVMPVSLDYMPWSHSLVMSLVWAAVFAAFVYGFTKDTRGAAITAAAVFSHWVLDVIAHRPDMPLSPGVETRIGLGLWNSVPGTLAVELLMWGAAVFIYFRSTRATSASGRRGPAIFAGVLTLAYLGNIFGPPPANDRVFAVMILAAAVIIPIVWWLDSQRVPVTEPV